MIYGILGDIHANLEALEAVLEEMDKQGVKKFVSVGDLVGYGANPTEAIKKVQELGATVVAGNHDFAAIDKLNIDFFNAYARESALWTRNALSDEDKTYLRNLRLIEQVDNFTIVHSTLYSPELFEYIQTSYDAHLSFDQQPTNVSFMGHSHVPVTFFCEKNVSEIWYSQDTELPLGDFEKAIVNVGSVGQPRDDNPDACYVLYDSDQHSMVLRRVPYDVEKAREKIISSNLPEVLAARLLIGR